MENPGQGEALQPKQRLLQALFEGKVFLNAQARTGNFKQKARIFLLMQTQDQPTLIETKMTPQFSLLFLGKVMWGSQDYVLYASHSMFV